MSQSSNGVCGSFTQILYEYIPQQGFVSYQTFSSVSYCSDWQGWEIDGEHYMSILQYGNAACNVQVTVTNTLYKWNQTTELYIPYQTYDSFGGV